VDYVGGGSGPSRPRLPRGSGRCFLRRDSPHGRGKVDLTPDDHELEALKSTHVIEHSYMTELCDFADEIGDGLLKKELMYISSYAALRSCALGASQALDNADKGNMASDSDVEAVKLFRERFENLKAFPAKCAILRTCRNMILTNPCSTRISWTDVACEAQQILDSNLPTGCFTSGLPRAPSLGRPLS
jgi:hypothetical protein